MEGLTDRLLADIACAEPVYADGIAGAFNLGTNFLTCYFRWRPMQRDGVVIWEKTPAVVVVRPRASLLSPNGGLARMLTTAVPQGLAMH